MPTFNFEQQLKALEQLVAKMEQGDLSLEQSMKSFEAGIKIVRKCQAELNKAEQKITILQQGKETEFTSE